MAIKQILLAALALSTTACFHRGIDASVGLDEPISSPSFSKSVSQAAHTPWTNGNQILTLENGDDFYPPMLEAIRNAKQSVTFETFAYVRGNLANQFTVVLANKAKEGVPVHLILDAIGSAKLGPKHLKPLRQCGVQVHLYHPFNPLLPKRSNQRTHRKILIADGRIAFTGGAGFADPWTGNAQDSGHWRDTQYQIEGPAVAQLQHTFNENWQKLTGRTLQGPAYFPKLSHRGPYRAHFVADSPRDRSHPIAHSVLLAINAAQSSLILEQSYFVPNRTFRNALISAAKRGVKIEIIVPGQHIDSKPSRYASQNYWAALLRAGIHLYQYEPTMMHGKLLVADERFTIIGSGNLDDRSFFINDEVNLHVDSRAFAREQIAMFHRDLRAAREITLENLPEVLAPWFKRFSSGLIAPQL